MGIHYNTAREALEDNINVSDQHKQTTIKTTHYSISMYAKSSLKMSENAMKRIHYWKQQQWSHSSNDKNNKNSQRQQTDTTFKMLQRTLRSDHSTSAVNKNKNKQTRRKHCDARNHWQITLLRMRETNRLRDGQIRATRFNEPDTKTLSIPSCCQTTKTWMWKIARLMSCHANYGRGENTHRQLRRATT